MRIQAANTFYTGTYSVLNTKSSFPYAVKVEGYGKTRNQRSLFQFAHVTITEHMVNAKYGTKITNGPRVQMQTAGSKKKEDWTEVSKEQLAEVKLPASFEKLKEQKSYFYHGENISDYELVQTAVALGKMELPTDEKKCIPDRAAMDAFEVLVRDQAAPKNSWSNTLYSEDGKYTFTKTESGRWQMHLIDDAAIFIIIIRTPRACLPLMSGNIRFPCSFLAPTRKL